MLATLTSKSYVSFMNEPYTAVSVYILEKTINILIWSGLILSVSCIFYVTMVVVNCLIFRIFSFGILCVIQVSFEYNQVIERTVMSMSSRKITSEIKSQNLVPDIENCAVLNRFNHWFTTDKAKSSQNLIRTTLTMYQVLPWMLWTSYHASRYALNLELFLSTMTIV